MSLPAKKQEAVVGVGVFAPGADKFGWQTQERRKVDAVEALPLRWPSTPKERFDLFDAWHDVAMQIVQGARRGFRLMAVAKKVINWQAGIITNSNADLAMRAGRCSEKTVSREVGEYVRLGVFIVEDGWRKEGTQIIRTRTIRPGLPVNLNPEIMLPETPVDLDTSGPDRSGFDLDTSGPVDLDTSGPITIETIRGGGGDAA